MISFSDIKVCFIDIDGTLTNGIYQISENGVVTKSFYTRDFYAIERIMKAGIKVVILTQSHDGVIYKQIERICNHSDYWRDCYEENGQLTIFTGIKNKEYVVEICLQAEELKWDNVAYIGDAENDVGCMKKSLYIGCPKDAIDDVISEVEDKKLEEVEGEGWRSTFNGGKGAVHEICLKILREKSENFKT